MKRILITGATSYIGNAVEQYLMEYNAAQGRECYRVDKISLRDGAWENYDFTSYDTLLHVAGIAHADIGKVSEESKQEYYAVNCELAVKVARKAKKQGVPQFVYMSSVIVYGDSARVGETKHITREMPAAPANFYGDSKWQAEQKLQELTDENFVIAMVRCPMIYGKGSKGNFKLLCKLADKLPVFPEVTNYRSMLYIENLAEFLRQLAEMGIGGIFLPQNREYVTTAHMVKMIRGAKGKQTKLLRFLNPFVKLASRMPGKIGGMTNKAFGSLTIDKDISTREIGEYQVCSLEESVQRSVSRGEQ